jgi:hypothetical protein
VSEQQLVLGPAEPVVELELELVDVTIADQLADAVVIAAPAPAPTGLEQRNLFGEAERIAARAASASTRRQYASIFRAFGDWLAGELGRPPVVGDLDTDVIAAYARHLARAGGRGGRPAAPATTRVYLSMIRALAHDLGREDQVQGVRVPRHEPGPPETLTDTDYATCCASPIAARWSANATTPYCECWATAAFARPSCEASAPVICAVPFKRPPLPAVRARQGRARARGPGAAGRAAAARGLAQGPSPRSRGRVAG